MGTPTNGRQSTSAIRGSIPYEPLHKLSCDRLADAWISSQSRWYDEIWILDNPTPGSAPYQNTIIWNLELPDGRLLTDPRHLDMLDWLRRFVWSLVAAPGDNASPLKPSSASHLKTGIHYFARWMVDTGRSMPLELEANALADYQDDLKSMRLLDEADDETESEASLSTVVDRIRIPILIWQQRAALRAAGIIPPPREPYEGRGANTIAKEVTSKRSGWIRPLPDEVALSVLNAARDFIDVPAQDILELQDQVLTAYHRDAGSHHKGPGTSKSSRIVAARKAGKAYQFNCRPGDNRPWHAPLRPIHETWNATSDYGPEITRLSVMAQVRRLVQDLTHACCLIIQGTTGMRMSELCGLQAGIDGETGLPSCVSREDSNTGLNTLYIVRTRLTKTEDTPRSVNWVLGMTPKNAEHADEIPPPAVRALEVLNRLLAPYRHLLGSNDLLVSFTNRVGLPKTSTGVRRIQASNVLQGMRDFCARYVDWASLPDQSYQAFEANDLIQYKESAGTIIKSHQWRKFFANFAIRIDSRLLPTLQMHFKHISLAMTEGGYVGSDPSLLSEVESSRDQMTALSMWEIARGEMSINNLGQAGTELQRAVDERLRPRVEGQDEGVAWRETVRFTEELGATFHFSPYATCAAYLISEMRCHQEAGTTDLVRWRHNNQPNFAHRRPSKCAGCPNAIFDTSHRPFWRDRYVNNRRAVLELRSRGSTAGLRVFEVDMRQARSLLRHLGEDVDALDATLDAGRDETADTAREATSHA